ncbi:hypothetical protein [Bifidobacterium moukalabense]|uniref:hypothetical protein n=1 Tax=Bifidobacterium moukalabense TaxID=1333651 RepID=UPI0010F799B8|nr:hypothetical protein [Bifidobacterium moukalabense]
MISLQSVKRTRVQLEEELQRFPVRYVGEIPEMDTVQGLTERALNAASQASEHASATFAHVLQNTPTLLLFGKYRFFAFNQIWYPHYHAFRMPIMPQVGDYLIVKWRPTGELESVRLDSFYKRLLFDGSKRKSRDHYVLAIIRPPYCQ